MNTADLLNTILIIGLFILIASWVFITFFLIQTLKAITRLMDNLEETTKDINALKGSLKMKFLTALPVLLASLAGKIIRRRR